MTLNKTTSENLSVSMSSESTSFDTAKNVIIRVEASPPRRGMESIRELSSLGEKGRMSLDEEIEAVPFHQIANNCASPLGVLSFDTENASVVSNITPTPTVLFSPNAIYSPSLLPQGKAATDTRDDEKPKSGMESLLHAFHQTTYFEALEKLLESVDERLIAACDDRNIEMILCSNEEEVHDSPIEATIETDVLSSKIKAISTESLEENIEIGLDGVVQGEDYIQNDETDLRGMKIEVPLERSLLHDPASDALIEGIELALDGDFVYSENLSPTFRLSLRPEISNGGVEDGASSHRLVSKFVSGNNFVSGFGSIESCKLPSQTHKKTSLFRLLPKSSPNLGSPRRRLRSRIANRKARGSNKTVATVLSDESTFTSHEHAGALQTDLVSLLNEDYY